MLPNTPWLQWPRLRQHNHCHRGYFGGGCGSWGGFEKYDPKLIKLKN